MNELFTASKARLKLIRSNSGENINWILLPGGPGFDSSYFLSFSVDLTIPGNIWHCDLPGNGSNILTENDYNFSHWRQALLDVVKSLANVILVAHSFGAIFTLTVPELETELMGLVLICAATKSWNQTTNKIAEQRSLPVLDKSKHQYLSEISDAAYKRFSLSAGDYFFTPQDATLGRDILKQTAMTHAPFEWAISELFVDYDAQWIPDNIPTLFIGAENDFVTPFCVLQNDSRLRQAHIELELIAGASHFPWIQEKQQVMNCLKKFSEKFQRQTDRRSDQTKWVDWVAELQAIAQNGLTFSRNVFDTQRYQQLQTIAAKIAASQSEQSFDNIQQLFSLDTDYATPKICVRAAVFKDNKILLVQERDDELWSLPGGWADINCTPTEAIIKEVMEESGFKVTVKQLIALHDKRKHQYPTQLPHCYIALFLCELVGGSALPSIETQAIDFFSYQKLPPLSHHRVNHSHIELCFLANAKSLEKTLVD